MKKIVFLLISSFIFLSCRNPDISHEHTYSDEWTCDAFYHWYDASCEHDNEVKDKLEHAFSEWKVIKEASEETEGIKERSCTVCSYKEEKKIEKLEHTHKYAEEWSSDENHHWYKATCEHDKEVKDKSEHAFSEWKVIKEASEETEGTKERSCTVCSYKEEKKIEKLEHIHKYADEWTSDETKHWHAAICGHEEVSDIADHTLGDWNETDAITLIRTCDECNYVEEMLNIENIKATNLPIVKINTVDGLSITSKEDWKDAVIDISNVLDESWNLEELDIEIKGRGNSTWTMPKKSYSIKLSSKKEILGMKKHKRWVLVANYSDKTLLRNYLVSGLGNMYFNSEWNPSFKSVNLILNGEYYGVYILGEQIKIDSKRVDIQAIDEIEKDVNGDDEENLDDGGFICEVNARMDELFNFTTTKGIKISLKEPDEVSTDIQEKIKSVVQSAEDVLYSEYWLDSEIGYSKYFDLDSFVDWYIVNELTKNNDACFFSSVYFYYNPSDKLIHMGPNWDFDISCGNINYNGCDNPEGYWIKNSGWIKRMFQDTNFENKVKARWNENREDIYSYINTSIQENADYLSDAAELNFSKWDILGTYVWPNADGYAERTTYQSEVDYLIGWLNKRFEFLDKEFID